MLFEQIDAAAGRQCQTADRGGHRNPVALHLAEIFVACADGAVLLDQRLHQIIDRLEAFGLGCGIPGGHSQNVVPGMRLLLGRAGQHQLVTLRGDEVDGHLDLLSIRPFMAELGQRVVGARDPMVPEPDGQLTRRMGTTHKGRSEGGRGQRRRPEQRPPRQ